MLKIDFLAVFVPIIICKDLYFLIIFYNSSAVIFTKHDIYDKIETFQNDKSTRRYYDLQH